MRHILIACLVLAATGARAEDTEDTRPELIDPTGFCYRFIEAQTPAGQFIYRKEVVLVKPSSRRDKDVQRLEDMGDSTFGFRPGHQKTDTWFGGWMADNRIDMVADEPDCSGLPQLQPTKQ